MRAVLIYTALVVEVALVLAAAALTGRPEALATPFGSASYAPLTARSR